MFGIPKFSSENRQEQTLKEIEVCGVTVQVGKVYKLYYEGGHYRMGKVKKIQFTKDNAGNAPGYRIEFESDGFESTELSEIHSIGVAAVTRVEPFS